MEVGAEDERDVSPRRRDVRGLQADAEPGEERVSLARGGEG